MARDQFRSSWYDLPTDGRFNIHCAVCMFGCPETQLSCAGARQFILNWGRHVFCGTVPFWHLIYHVPRVILKSTIVLHKSEIRTLLIFLNLIISIWKFYLSNFKDKIFCCCWGGGGVIMTKIVQKLIKVQWLYLVAYIIVYIQREYEFARFYKSYKYNILFSGFLVINVYCYLLYVVWYSNFGILFGMF